MSRKEIARPAPAGVAPVAPAVEPAQNRQPALQQSQELNGGVPKTGGAAAAQAQELRGAPAQQAGAPSNAQAGGPNLGVRAADAVPDGPLTAEQVQTLVEKTGIQGSNESNCKPDAEAMVKALWALDQSVRADIVQTRAGPRNHYHVRVGKIVVDTTYRQFFSEPVGRPIFVGTLPALKALLVENQSKLNPRTTAGPDGAQLFEGAFEGKSTYVYRDGEALMNWKAPGQRPAKRGHVTWTKAEEGMDPEARQKRRPAVPQPQVAPTPLSRSPELEDDNVMLDFARHASALRRPRNTWDPDAQPDLPPMKTDADWAAYLEANGKATGDSRIATVAGGTAAAGWRETHLDGKTTRDDASKVEIQKDRITLKNESSDIDADGDEAKGTASLGVDAAGNVHAGVGAHTKRRDGSSHGVSGQASLSEGKVSVEYAGAGKERLVADKTGLDAKKQATWGAGGGIDLAEDGSLEGADGKGKVGDGGVEVGVDVGFVDSVKIVGSGPFIVQWTDAVHGGIDGGGTAQGSGGKSAGGKLSHKRTKSRVRSRSFATRAEAEACQKKLRSGVRPADNELAAGETLRMQNEAQTGAGLSALLPGVSLSAGGSVAVMSGWAVTLSADGETLIVRRLRSTTGKGNLGADTAVVGASVTASQTISEAEVYRIPLTGPGRAEFERLKAAGFKTTPAKAYFVDKEHTTADARGTGLTVAGGTFKRERTRAEGVEIDDATAARLRVSQAGGTSGFTGPKLPGTETRLGPRMTSSQQARFVTSTDGETIGGVDGAVDFSDAGGQAQALAEAAGGSAPDASMVRPDEQMVPVSTRTDLSDADIDRVIAAVRAGQVDLFAAAGGGVTTDTQPMLRLQKRLLARTDPDAQRRAIADYLDEVKNERDGLAQLRALSGAETWVVPQGHADVFWPKSEYARVKGQIDTAVAQGKAGAEVDARTALQAIKTRVQYVLGRLGDTTGYMTQIPMHVRDQTSARMRALQTQIDDLFRGFDAGVDPDADSEVQEAQRQTRDARAMAAGPHSGGEKPLVAQSNPHLHQMAERRRYLMARRATLRAIWADAQTKRAEALHATKMHSGVKGESASWMGNGLNARSVVGESSAYMKAENHRAAADAAWSLAAQMQAQIDTNPDTSAADEQHARGLLDGQIQNVDDVIDTYRSAVVAYTLSSDILHGIRARTEKDHPKVFAGYSDAVPEQANVALPRAFAESKRPMARTPKAVTLSPREMLDRHVALDEAKAALADARGKRTHAHGLAVHVHRTFINGRETQVVWQSTPRFMKAFHTAEVAFRGHDKTLEAIVARGLGAQTAALKATASRLGALSQLFAADHARFEVANAAGKAGE